MNSALPRKWINLTCAILLSALPSFPQDHKWAGRTLDALESRIHEELAMIPFHGVFDTLHFELQHGIVTLSGHVIRETVRSNAERAVKRIEGVDHVVNQIELLPSSKSDDAIRLRIYRAIYGSKPLEKYGMRSSPSIHIIVKDGTVTLDGIVDSAPDRDTAYRQASQLARSVSNSLLVAPEE